MSIPMDTLFKLIMYTIGILSVTGIWISANSSYAKIKERFRIQREIRLSNYTQKWLKYTWMKQYHLLLDSSIRRYRLDYFSKIVVTQALLFLFFTLLFRVVLEEYMFSAMISAIIVIILPISGLYFVHKQRQNDAQDKLVETAIYLLQEYEKHNHHMLYALKATIAQLEGPVHSVYAKAFARMHGDDATKMYAAEALTFQIGHVRGKNLANIILRGCKDGTNVSTLLEDLVEDITEFNKRVRDAQTEARETAMIGFAPLPLLIILYFVNDLYLIPGGNTFHYQFLVPEGLKSFLIAAVFGVIGIGLGIFVRKPKGM